MKCCELPTGDGAWRTILGSVTPRLEGRTGMGASVQPPLATRKTRTPHKASGLSPFVGLGLTFGDDQIGQDIQYTKGNSS